jgi:hypothetical protein
MSLVKVQVVCACANGESIANAEIASARIVIPAAKRLVIGVYIRSVKIIW